MPTISVPYGEAQKRFEIAESRLLSVFGFPDVAEPSPEEERAAVVRALRQPIGAAPIGSLARAGQRAVILVDDWTRPTPAFKVLPAVLEELAEAGCSENVSIVIARGTHRRLSPAEVEHKVGKEAMGRLEVSNHEAEGDLVYLGESSRGTPAWINRKVAEADLRIAIGSIVAHPIAGYGGGAKIIVPGVAGRETIHKNHSLADDPNVTLGCADGNPVREDMEEIARMARLDLVVNTILSPARRVLDAVAGDVVLAHRKGIERYRRIYGAEIQEAAEVGVVGASPRDATFGHATFALYAALPMVRPGGAIILVAPCTDGPGTREGRESFRRLAQKAPAELMALIRSGEVDASGGAFDHAYSKAVSRYRVVLVSDSYSREEAEQLGVGYGGTLQQAVDTALASAGDGAKASVMPLGGLTVPVATG